ncbi:MAG: hypothetical protein GXP51_05185 [Deltaproteobacteria bacterium]|nr:hypothetical protein [Deltaproteobacteria bacterium]
MKTNRKLIAVTAVLAIVAMAVPGFAGMNNGSNSQLKSGPAAVTDTASLTAEQQQKVADIQARYQPELQDLQQKLNAKQDAFNAARSDDATTVGQLNNLENELSSLERAYLTKLDQANQELSLVAGTGYGPQFACDNRGGNHGNMMQGNMMRGGMMMGNMMQDGRSVANADCCR